MLSPAGCARLAIGHGSPDRSQDLDQVFLDRGTDQASSHLDQRGADQRRQDVGHRDLAKPISDLAKPDAKLQKDLAAPIVQCAGNCICKAGETCAFQGSGSKQVCETGSKCTTECNGGLCTATCLPGAICTFACAGGSCIFVCSPTGGCTTSCGGGSCITTTSCGPSGASCQACSFISPSCGSLNCPAGEACSQTCSAGGCTLTCSGASICQQSCTGGGCTLNCGTPGACKQSCSGSIFKPCTCNNC